MPPSSAGLHGRRVGGKRKRMKDFSAIETALRSIAYFTMEIALESSMPSYSGGLGVLAGDTIRAGADMKVPMVAVSLLYRQGYFSQRLDAEGTQLEEPVNWHVEDFLKEESARVSITIEEREVELRCWRYDARGVTGYDIPIYFLDSDLPSNDLSDRLLTGGLYRGDRLYRLCQETILGIGGVRMLRALGYSALSRFHMNEGHAGLLGLELLNEEVKKAGRRSFNADDVEKVRRKCLFTTHTPVPAGHDRFPMSIVHKIFCHREDFLNMQDVFCAKFLNEVLQENRPFKSIEEAVQAGTTLNMTYLALHLSGYVNGVAKLHGETSRKMFSDLRIESITNGIHAATWASPAFRELFDRYIRGWREDNFSLRGALGIPPAEVWSAHSAAKHRLFDLVRVRTGLSLDPEVFTIGFARRATGYKRAGLILSDLDRLKDVTAKSGAFQLIFAGKAHPDDGGGKEIIREIFRAKKALGKSLRIVYLDEYNMDLAAKLISGVDLWLNTPQIPLEASGTSGMKAALNGVPSLSVLDGWWVEGHIEGKTGWCIGDPSHTHGERTDGKAEAESLYHKLGDVILPLFYNHREDFVSVMQHAIALNGSFFHTQRMLQQYVTNAYFR
jgi:starch phosphorylase